MEDRSFRELTGNTDRSLTLVLAQTKQRMKHAWFLPVGRGCRNGKFHEKIEPQDRAHSVIPFGICLQNALIPIPALR